MRVVLILFIGLILTAAPLVIVQAEESQTGSEQVMDEQVSSENATVEAGAAEETATDREVYAKSLFEGRCQMCHQLPEPGMLRPKQWQLILLTMQQRMQQAKVPPLTDDETERLLEYLSARAR